MRRIVLTCLVGVMTLVATAQSKVYVTRDISPNGLVNVYKALGRKAEGRVAVKISTGESEKTGYLRPALIKDLVQMVNGTIVECNTAYVGSRASSAMHRYQPARSPVTPPNSVSAMCL